MRLLAGREVWRVGDWGGASGQIGRRWEEVGAAALGELVGKPSPSEPTFVPRVAVSFVHDSTREQALHAAGLAHADALLIGPLNGHLAIQPVDFKWSLEVAQAGQVSGETLRALLEADLPAIRGALEAQLEPAAWGLAPAEGGLPPADEIRLLDGFFLSPDHGPNRTFLESQANLRQEQPLTERQVAFVRVEGTEFFSPLPGWHVAEAIAAQEGARRSLAMLEGAEHYYRLGAGVLGALTASHQSIFAPTPPPIDALAELTRLRRAQRLFSTPQLIAYLDRIMSARRELVKAFNGLGRTAYPFGAFRATLKAHGITLPDRSEAGPEHRRWSRLYGLTQAELSARLTAEGRALVAAGQNDAQAVAALTARGAEWGKLGATIAARLIAAETASGGN